MKAVARKTFGWMIVCELVLVLQPYPIKWLFDGLQERQPESSLLALCAAMGLLYLLGTRLHNKQLFLRNAFFWQVWGDLWGYSHLRELKLDTGWHVAHSTGEKDSIVARNIGKVEHLIDEVLFNTLPAAMRIILVAIGIWCLGKHFGILLLVTIVVFGVKVVGTEFVMGPLRKQFRKQMKRLEVQGSELVKNWRTLKQFGIEEDHCEKHWNSLDEFRESESLRNRIFSKHWKGQEDIVSAARMLMYATVVHFYDPRAGIGSVVLATAWMERVFSNFYRFDGFQRSLNEGREAAEELCRIFELVPAVRQPENPLWPEHGIKGHFEFRDVSFGFSGQKTDTLRALNLQISPNECIALVGRTGSGKSTLASLLMLEYYPTGGAIFLDGVDLHEIDYNRYRREGIAIVSQKIDLFDGTVLQNIRLSRPDATMDEVIEAARHADAHEFIVRMEKGYDQKIGDDGIVLSGGQRQRLAIARALLRRPHVLVMDEATSSLDAESQAEVQKANDRLIQQRLATIIIIAHRLSTIRQADRIVVLDDGRIVESGPHKELASRPEGLYRYFLDHELRSFD